MGGRPGPAEKTSKPNAAAAYAAVAGQVIKSARNRAERYRALGEYRETAVK